MSSQVAIYMAGKIKMRERKWSDFIHTSSSLLIFIFNKRGLGRIPRKRTVPTKIRQIWHIINFSQSNVIVHVLNSILHAEILISLKESTTTLFRLWDNQSPNFSTRSTRILHSKKSLRICKNLMGRPGRSWGRPAHNGYATKPSRRREAPEN